MVLSFLLLLLCLLSVVALLILCVLIICIDNVAYQCCYCCRDCCHYSHDDCYYYHCHPYHHDIHACWYHYFAVVIITVIVIIIVIIIFIIILISINVMFLNFTIVVIITITTIIVMVVILLITMSMFINIAIIIALNLTTLVYRTVLSFHRYVNGLLCHQIIKLSLASLLSLALSLRFTTLLGAAETVLPCPSVPAFFLLFLPLGLQILSQLRIHRPRKSPGILFQNSPSIIWLWLKIMVPHLLVRYTLENCDDNGKNKQLNMQLLFKMVIFLFVHCHVSFRGKP